MPIPDKTSAPPVSPPPVSAAAPVPQRLRWSSRTLLAGQREVEIEHDHKVYRLQLTSLGKLILTK
jgi:hemin uptake protein HemP